MFRKILPFFLIAVVFMLDNTILPMLTDFWLIPVFGLVLVHCLGLLLGRTRGSLYGMIMGLLVDISVSTPLGLMTVFYTLLAFAGGWFGHVLRKNKLVAVVSAAVCFPIYEFFMDLYVIFTSAQFDSGMLIRSLIRIPVYVGAVYGGVYLLNKLLKPNRSRFAPR